MEKLLKVLTLVVGMTLILGLSTTHAFNSAAHLYIAQQVYQVQNKNTDLHYGSIAPDLALYTYPDKWPTSFEDTHYAYIDLRDYAHGLPQKAFAKGWLTHNEDWGADFYAHRMNPRNNKTCVTAGDYQGYVIEKACLLSAQTGIYNPDFTHLVVEIAIDLLLRNNVDLNLGKKLLNANSSRSLVDRTLLATVLVGNEQRTDRVTLATTELSFRTVVDLYARALKLPSPYNEQALAAIGSQLAELYGMELSEEEALDILEVAINLCKDDYKQVIEEVISAIKVELGL